MLTGCTCAISYCNVVHNNVQLGKTQENCTLKYVFVTKSQCPNVQKERAGLTGRQVMGTLQVHAGRQVMGTLQVHAGRQVMVTLQVHAGRQVMVTLQVHAGRQVMVTLQVHAGRQVMVTLQVHVVIILSVEGIVVKDMTCFCDECFSNCKVEPVCEGWKIHSTVK